MNNEDTMLVNEILKIVSMRMKQVAQAFLFIELLFGIIPFLMPTEGNILKNIFTGIYFLTTYGFTLYYMLPLRKLIDFKIPGWKYFQSSLVLLLCWVFVGIFNMISGRTVFVQISLFWTIAQNLPIILTFLSILLWINSCRAEDLNCFQDTRIQQGLGLLILGFSMKIFITLPSFEVFIFFRVTLYLIYLAGVLFGLYMVAEAFLTPRLGFLKPLILNNLKTVGFNQQISIEVQDNFFTSSYTESLPRREELDNNDYRPYVMKFCPLCGKNLEAPAGQSPKFCSNCGNNLYN